MANAISCKVQIKTTKHWRIWVRLGFMCHILRLNRASEWFHCKAFTVSEVEVQDVKEDR